MRISLSCKICQLLARVIYQHRGRRLSLALISAPPVRAAFRRRIVAVFHSEDGRVEVPNVGRFKPWCGRTAAAAVITARLVHMCSWFLAGRAELGNSAGRQHNEHSYQPSLRAMQGIVDLLHQQFVPTENIMKLGNVRVTELFTSLI